MARNLTDKLEHWDEHADDAFEWMLTFAREHKDEVLAVARGRHVLGHHRLGDSKFYEYSKGELTAELIEELADGVNYTTRRLTI